MSREFTCMSVSDFMLHSISCSLPVALSSVLLSHLAMAGTLCCLFIQRDGHPTCNLNKDAIKFLQGSAGT